MGNAPYTDEARPFPPLGRFEKHLITPPQILGCERTPFLVLCGTVAFLVIAVVGIDIFSIIGGVLVLAGGVRWLREKFEQDPKYFAMKWMDVKYPRHLPDEHPPVWISDCAFVGYDDPPAPDAVFMAWLKVTVVMLVPAGLGWFFIGPVAGGLAFAGLMLAVALWAWFEDIANAVRKMADRG